MEQAEFLTKKFPNLHKLVSKAAQADDPMKFILIKSKWAIIKNETCTVVFNLVDYFENVLQMNEPELVLLDDVLEFLEGKYLSVAYWEQLTKGYSISLVESAEVEGRNYIELNNAGVTIDLIWKDPILMVTGFDYSDLIKYAPLETNAVMCNCNSFNFFAYLNAGLGSILKDDQIIMEHFGRDLQTRFTFDKARYIFGITHNNSNVNEQMLKNAEFDGFIQSNS
jgi:hypothetical protein